MNKLFTFLLTIVLGVTTWNSASAQTNYGIKIAGIEVTSSNASDLTVINGVSGDEVSYNPSNKTLKLKNATINKTGEESIRNDNVTDLIIALEGSNNLLSNRFLKNTKITGSGSLKANSTGVGLYVRPNATLTIENTTVEVESTKWGIAGNNGTSGENLIITNSTVKAIGTEGGSIMDLASFTLNDSKITTPAGAAFDSSLRGVALNGSLVKTQVVIEPAVRYGLKIAGANVTELNASNLTVIDGVSGDEVSYNPSTKTLKLKNATINKAGAEAIRNSDVTDLIVAVEGSNNLVSDGYSSAIFLKKNTKITGSGSLKANSEDVGLYVYSSNTTLTIEDTTVEVEADKWGIAGNNGTSEEHLIITNSTVKATGIENGSIVDFASLTLNYSKITAPVGAAFDNNLHSVALNGSLVKTQVVIEPVVKYGLKIAGVEVTELNASDLTVIDGVSGDEVSYNPSNKTLKLKNATINKSEENPITNNNITDLTVAIEGNNGLVDTSVLFKNTKITGSGSLKVNVTTGAGFFVRENTTFTIEDTTVEIESANWGITGYDGTSGENLIITNSTVKAKGTDFGSIVDLASLTLNNSKITTPAGAAFDSSLRGVALNGSLVKTQVVIEPDTSSVEDMATNAKISVYPNPVSDILYIKAEHAELAYSTVEIIDMMGKTVLQEELENGSISLNISHLKQGVYMVKIGKAVKRIIKK